MNRTEGTIATEEVPADYWNRFISGKGLGAPFLPVDYYERRGGTTAPPR